MLRTVQLHHKLRLVTIEIDNIITNDILSAKLEWISSQKLIPQQALFFGLALSQRLGILFQVLVPFHTIPSQRECRLSRRLSPFLIRPFGAPFPRGKVFLVRC